MSVSLKSRYEDDFSNKMGIIPHSDGETYTTITRVEIGNAEVYVERTITEIENPKWYHRPLYWIFNKL